MRQEGQGIVSDKVMLDQTPERSEGSARQV